MINLTDEDLISRLKNFEDHFVERKTSGDSKDDWVKTAVGFANSAAIDFPCVLYIGVRNNGDVEEKQVNLDTVQKTFNKEMAFVYPPVPYISKILSVEGRQCLAVIVPGSPERPHFAGPAYVRVGSETRNASESQYNEMLALRNSKVRKILEFKGEVVTVNDHAGGVRLGTHGWGGVGAVVADCNQWWITLHEPPDKYFSFSLSRIELSFDDENDTLCIEITR